MKVANFVLAVLAIALPVVATTPLYAQCVALGSLTSLVGVVPGLLSSLVGILGGLVGTLSGDDCKSACKAQGKKFAVWAQGIDLTVLVRINSLLGSCYCNDVGVPAQYVMETDSQGTCSTTVANLIGARVDYLVPNQMTFLGCSQNPPTIAPGTSVTTVATIEACATACGNSLSGGNLVGTTGFAVRAKATETCGLVGDLLNILTGRTNAGYECQCAAATNPNLGTNCNTEYQGTCTGGVLGIGATRPVTFAWNNYNMVPTASGIARRRLPAAPLTAEEKFCPQPKIPCNVRNSATGFECVDTNSELESCGGCPLGDSVRNVTSGVDCTTIPGVAMGGVSCVRGQCLVNRCKAGFELSKGKCVRKLNLSNARRVVRDI